ncbi:MAG: glycerophosphodiester phosphodiesterase [Chloroflexota bacterium]
MTVRTGPDEKVPLIIAHRGGAPDDIDNSWDAFASALRNGIDILESDVQVTADGALVVLHDERIEGVPVRNLRLVEIRTLVPTIMTFGDFLDRVEEMDAAARFVIDMKGRDTDHYLAPVIQERGLALRSLVTSKHAPSLRRLAKQVPNVRTGLSRGGSLTTDLPWPLHHIFVRAMRLFVITVGVVQARWCHARYAVLQYSVLDRPTVRRLHRLGFRVDAWTVDDPDAARRLAANGVDLITSNIPVALRDDRADDPL